MAVYPQDAAAVVAAYEKALGQLSLEAVKAILRALRASGGNSAKGLVRQVGGPLAESRQQAWRVAFAFYRLYAAVSTGYTVSVPKRVAGGDAGRAVSVGVGRIEDSKTEGRVNVDAGNVDAAKPMADTRPPARRVSRTTVGQLRREFQTVTGVKVTLRTPDREPVTVEPISLDEDAGKASLERFVSSTAKAIEDWANKIPEDSNAGQMFEGDEYNKPLGDEFSLAALERREAAASKKESRITGAYEKAVLDVARDTVAQTAKAHGRAIGWVRKSGTGSPCAFCAMLLTAGPRYKSAHAAERHDLNTGGSGESGGYHTNCHCYAVPVFTYQEFYESDQFKLNRQMWSLYKNVKKNGDPVNEMRRVLENRTDKARRKREKTWRKRRKNR